MDFISHRIHDWGYRQEMTDRDQLRIHIMPTWSLLRMAESSPVVPDVTLSRLRDRLLLPLPVAPRPRSDETKCLYSYIMSSRESRVTLTEAR